MSETHDDATIALLSHRLSDAMAERNIVGAADVLAAVAASQHDMTAQFGNASRELLLGQTNGFRDLVNTTNDLDGHVAHGFSAVGVQAEKLSAAQALATNSVGALVNLASKDIQIAGLKTQLEMSAKFAECCCEIKQAIHADGEATRALINCTNTASLQAQLNDAKDAVRDQAVVNAILNQRGATNAAK